MFQSLPSCWLLNSCWTPGEPLSMCSIKYRGMAGVLMLSLVVLPTCVNLNRHPSAFSTNTRSHHARVYDTLKIQDTELISRLLEGTEASIATIWSRCSRCPSTISRREMAPRYAKDFDRSKASSPKSVSPAQTQRHRTRGNHPRCRQTSSME